MPATDPQKLQELLINLRQYAVDMENMGRADAIATEYAIFDEHVVLSRSILETINVKWNGQVYHVVMYSSIPRTSLA